MNVLIARPLLFSQTRFVQLFFANHSKHPYSQAMAEEKPKDIFGFTVKNIDGNDVNLSSYKGYVSLIVNVASFWGLTKTNYNQLQELYDKFSGDGLKILAFPCNQFNNQEPKSNEEIKQFACGDMKVTFDMFSKVNVNGDDAISLFKFLRGHKKTGGFLTNALKWNFTKFLIDRQGIPRKRFAPNVNPLDMIKDIEKLLAEPKSDGTSM